MNGKEKAAAILSLLGDELSHKVLSYLPESDAISIISASEKLKTPNREILFDLVSEFNEYMTNADKISIKTGHQEKENITQTIPTGTPLEIISKSSSEKIAGAIAVERPEIAAYVLSHLPIEKIYEILQLIKEGREAIESRLINIKDVPISKELEEKILKTISERLV